MTEFKRTHHGKAFGIPVYLDMRDEECPGVEAKYFLGFALTIMEYLFLGYCLIKEFQDPTSEPMIPLMVGPEVEQEL